MKTSLSIKSQLIAPCGMNCGICMAYLREKKRCPGCRGSDESKSSYCVNCRIKNCVELKKYNVKFCFDCEKIPCDRLKRLDKRYRTKYNMSMLENLESKSLTVLEKGNNNVLRKKLIGMKPFRFLLSQYCQYFLCSLC